MLTPIITVLSFLNTYGGISRLNGAGPLRVRPDASKCAP
jgi:hypothetical protein